MSRGTFYNYPDNDLLDRAVRAKGVYAVAREIDIPPTTLQAHCVRNGIATQRDPVELSDDALVRLANLVAS